MFDGFQTHSLPGDGVTISARIGGAGPPLVLLHGYPQNGASWHRVAPRLAQDFTVIVPDLRGYGASDAPPDDADHHTYSKRRMARDIVSIMAHLGHDRFAVLGHDRGARVGYRMALDYPNKVSQIGIIEIVPTGDFWGSWAADLALKAYHWTFLAQPAPLPERMIGADPVAYIDWTLGQWTLDKSMDAFAPEALSSYRAQARDPARIHAMCSDYRAGATVDRALDDADRAAGRKLAAPLRFLWARHGFPAATGDPAGLWRRWSDDVTDSACDSGHFVPEENPSAVLDCFLPFFDKGRQ